MAVDQSFREVQTWCALCVSRCGATAQITDGRFTALKPLPAHATGRAVCTKGKAGPELVEHPDRLLVPLRRTNRKGAADPGWEEIGWDEALDSVAERLLALRARHGAESVVFSNSSPSCTSISDSVDWIMRLRRAFGSPNHMTYMELCGWGRYLASIYTYGASVPGVYMPDLDHAGIILYWGYNPSVARLAHATATVAALRRGARLVVVDPKRAGLAGRADHWLRVRPGTDAALALAMVHVLLDRGWFDEHFVRQWTNAPLLVREDTGRFLRAGQVWTDAADPEAFVAWDTTTGQVVAHDPGNARRGIDDGRLGLRGRYAAQTPDGPVACRTVFDLVSEHAGRMEPSVAEGITDVPADQIEAAARLLWESRPVAFYTWSGLEQHSNTTQSVRAIHLLYALLGSLDVKGGNVAFTPVPTNPIDGVELLPPAQASKAVGLEGRPLGPARFEFVNGEDVFDAILEARPYPVRGMVNFGANLTMAHGNSARVRDALAALDLFVHADLFMNPTAEQADIVLPVASAFEAEALRVGFEVSQVAASTVQLRAPLVPARGQSRSDLQLVFDLAGRLGLGEHFWDGDIEAAFRHQLEPSGVTIEQLRERPGGIQLPLETHYRKYAATDGDGPVGFRTPSGRVELYSEVMLDHGYTPMAAFEEPATSPRSRPDLAERFPLVLTNAKGLHFCETQHRNLPRVRSRQPDPEVELHPDTAAERRIVEGDWVGIETPAGTVRARAVFDPSLARNVVVAQHGWWQGCEQLELAAHPPFGPDSANLNLVLSQTPSDPISGSSPLRSSVCDVVGGASASPR
jgi:anaerobic selenocysteine-containing dehydrogenase